MQKSSTLNDLTVKKKLTLTHLKFKNEITNETFT